MKRDILRQLEEAGRRSVPAPRPGFTVGLEDRLRAVARTPSPEESPSPRPHRGRPSFGVATSLVAVVVLLGVVVGVGGLGDRSSGGYELTHAVNVEVALADGTTLVDPDGLLLPDDAIVTIGLGGSARIGAVTLAAGDVATVDGPDLRIDRSGRPNVATATGSAGTARPATPSTRPASPTPPPASTATPTRSPTPPSPTKPTPTGRPATPRPDATPAPTATRTGSLDRPSATIKPKTPPPPTDIKPLKLTARLVGPSDVGAMWTGTPGARRYVLVASGSKDGAAADPTHPGSPIIGTFTHPPTEPLLFRVPKDVLELRLRVVALDADGVELTRSNIVTIAFPRESARR